MAGTNDDSFRSFPAQRGPRPRQGTAPDPLQRKPFGARQRQQDHSQDMPPEFPMPNTGYQPQAQNGGGNRQEPSLLDEIYQQTGLGGADLGGTGLGDQGANDYYGAEDGAAGWGADQNAGHHHASDDQASLLAQHLQDVQSQQQAAARPNMGHVPPGNQSTDPRLARPFENGAGPQPRGMTDEAGMNYASASGQNYGDQNYNTQNYGAMGDQAGTRQAGGRVLNQDAYSPDPSGHADGWNRGTPPTSGGLGRSGASTGSGNDFGGFQSDLGQQPMADAGFGAAVQSAGPAVMHDMEDEPKRGRWRTLIVLAGILVIGGSGAFAWNEIFNGGGDSGSPPLVRSNTGSVKARPDEPGGKKFAYSGNSIYDKMQGNNTKDDARLVSREEDVKDDTRYASNEAGSSEGGSETVPGQPRRVKTLVVRPDGTIVRPDKTNDTPQAYGGVISGDSDPYSFNKSSPSKSESRSPAIGSAAVIRKKPEANDTAKVVKTTSRTQPVPEKKKIVAPVKKTRTAAVASPPRDTAGTGNFVVQLASQRSETEALSIFSNLQRKYPTILSEHIPLIQRADLGSKGVWYRLRVGPLESKGEANTVCGRLKNAGWASCFVRAL